MSTRRMPKTRRIFPCRPDAAESGEAGEPVEAREPVETGELVAAGESIEAGEPDNSRQPAQTATVPFELPAATNHVEGISGEGTFVAGGVPDGVTRGLLAG